MYPDNRGQLNLWNGLRFVTTKGVFIIDQGSQFNKYKVLEKRPTSTEELFVKS
jgi:hypothetical protein